VFLRHKVPSGVISGVRALGVEFTDGKKIAVYLLQERDR
jgi:hypothetical protein